MKLKYDFAVREICGETVAVAIGEGSRVYHNIISLNETARDIFKLIQEGNDEDAIVTKMMAEYDVTEERLRPEVQALIAKLREEELIVDEN
ncbi:MAG: PqqD family protein [Paludibacteraceae bacterium]|nr:PqqD family protein [Paludibacteraceae bacterium]